MLAQIAEFGSTVPQLYPLSDVEIAKLTQLDNIFVKCSGITE
jgi:hypothetical protein